MTTLTCRTCGAAVDDLAKHSKWHENTERHIALGFKMVNCEIEKIKNSHEINHEEILKPEWMRT